MGVGCVSTAWYADDADRLFNGALGVLRRSLGGIVSGAMVRPLSVLALCAVSLGTVVAQTRLDLDQALRLARENNGTIRAAWLDIEGARSRVRQNRAAFFPTITPDAGYRYQRQESFTGLRSTFKSDDAFAGIAASWRLLDSGQRQLGLAGSGASLTAQELSSLQTLRTTLTEVHVRYFEVLRARKLVEVSKSTVARAQEVLKQVQARIRVKDMAEKEELQAKADVLNAEVSLLSSQNRVETAEADLKAIIGWDSSQDLPDLADVPDFPAEGQMETLDALVAFGLENRPDLKSREASLKSLGYSLKRSQLEAGPTYTVDANFERRFGPSPTETSNLTAMVSMPLFDGNRSREAANEIRLNVMATESELKQLRRDAQASIESTYKTLTQNRQRLRAAKLAFDAAKLNYEAAEGAFSKGAADLIAVITAQVSLVTAESNLVEASYDTYIADVRIKLVSGKQVPGEQDLR